MCRFIPEAFQYVSVPARKIPNIARVKVVRLRLSRRIDHRGARTTFQHKRPFGGRCVPMQLAHHAWLKLHRDASDSFGDRQLFDSYFFAKTVPENLPLRFFQFEFERRQFFPGQQWVRKVVSKTVTAHQSAFLKRFGCEDQVNPDFAVAPGGSRRLFAVRFPRLRSHLPLADRERI